MTREISSKNIEGIADLVVCAPIKQGFIDAFENITYETRLRLATKALHELRVAAREHELTKPFTDVVERIQSLLAFRVGILDTAPRRSLILAATFDRAWEPYMRLIWNPLGAFLDVLFCNCEDYVTATDHSFAQYAQWVRDHQVDSTIFYATTPLTVGDQLYLEKLERLQRVGGPPGADLTLAQMTADDPDDLSRKVRARATPRNPREQQVFLTMATEALVVLYGLADYYPPDRPQGDGKYLLRAARDLLDVRPAGVSGGWDTTDKKQLPQDVKDAHGEMFRWLATNPPPLPVIPPDSSDFRRCEVQAGVLSGYDRGDALVKHGALLLLGVTDAQAARKFIEDHLDQVSWEGDPGPKNDDGAFVNIAITKRGLANLGVPDTVIAGFPKEFREGMDERAGLIGDIHANHPRRWPLPERFQYAIVAPPPGQHSDPYIRPRVELSEIDIVLQLRTARGGWDYEPLPNDEAGLATSNHPLAKKAPEILARATKAGVRLLSIEPMRRLRAPSPGGQQMRDHFGFRDFVSQPALEEDQPTPRRDVVKRGELVLGYGNDRGDPPFTYDSSTSDPSLPFMRDGSFLVIRKLRQDVGALNRFLAKPTGANPALQGEALLAKMAGRHRNGDPLAAGGSATNNDFDFAADTIGDPCPFQAHIRRANPRLSGVTAAVAAPFGRPTPRIMRRGMSFGPDFARDRRAKRGVVFMAYSASLAEQFEVIQRWINGGNSTGVAAAQNDPLIGVHPAAGAKTLRFANGGDVVRVDIPRPFVGVEWGLYAFVPSRTALTHIARSRPDWPIIGDAARGEAIVQALLDLPDDEARAAWKTYLEDFSAKDPAERSDTPDVWAAIRDNHGGALRIPDWVLVASNDLINAVFLDPGKRYSVSGSAQRMLQSMGEIYVGFDPGDRYDREATATNAAIMALTKAQAFEVAHDAAEKVVKGIFLAAAKLNKGHPGAQYPAEIDLRTDFITRTLALVCNYWFGLPDILPPPFPSPPVPPGFIKSGGWNWESVAGRTPQCPGDFMAVSRYCFYPGPTEAIAAYGIVQGARLHAVARAYFDALRRVPPGGPAKPGSTGPLTAAMCAAHDDNDLLARNLIGIMVGALPPLEGNLRSVLYDWIKEKTLWRYQQALLAYRNGGGSATIGEWAVNNLEADMAAAMQKRPAPDLLWRTAIKPHRLGEVDIEPGDKLILSVVSATLEQQNNQSTDDVFPIFGGDRSASPHPVHACPAYEMAMGTMLGILTALFEAGQIEALPGALLVKLTPPPTPAPKPAPSAPARARRGTRPASPKKPASTPPASSPSRPATPAPAPSRRARRPVSPAKTS